MFSPVNGSVWGASPAVVVVVLGDAPFVVLVEGPVLAPLDAAVELEPGELPFELLALVFELLALVFELLDDELCEELVGGLDGFVHPASGSTYCWLPADGVHPPWAEAIGLMARPSPSDTRMQMRIRGKRVKSAY